MPVDSAKLSELEMEDAGQVSSEEEIPKPRKAGGGGRPRKIVVESESEKGSDSGENSDWDSDKPKKEKKAAAKKGGAAGKKTKLPASSKASTKLEVGAGAGGKKRGNTSKAKGQKLIEDMFMPAPSNAMTQQEPPQESSPAQKSPAQKVRRMRPSPFHKKSGSVSAKLAESDEEEEVFKGPAGARPKRANRTVVQYTISDDDEESAGDDYSDFAAEESE